ncbi:glutathione S-transferase family protein [Marinobacterium sediminicola]|uniref:Glutathione S-transferase, C-terminal domain n=1 Tax=Marinobacterium sediminicola TaxID=518898 RepID=A0ABY1RYN0_9GAMM|nr:glutathione S-transferase [Marinobacterium sediminicola]ULG68102.1 glutathione S-transferase [Marinobacterium sediminicola]SMR73386.1 Glutathione S-transferase, C-terminal domain [Marinobacterium sediminicola]
MKLHEKATTPSAQRVHIFMRELGIDIDRVDVDIRAAENRSEAFMEKAPNGLIPVLELDDGTWICESVAICRYLDAITPNELALFGNTPLEQAQVEMWQRILEFQGVVPAFQAFRNISGFFSDRETCIKEWGEESRKRLIAFLPTLDRQLSQHPWIAGERYSIADITAWILCGFLSRLDIELDDTLSNLKRWHQQMSQRPSVQ